MIASALFAGTGEVTVKVSAPGLTASAALPKAKVAARRAAVKKYLESLKLKDLPEKVLADAQASYAKFTSDDIEEIQDEREFDNADKELTTSFTVEVDMPAISAWLGEQGLSANAGPDGSSYEIVIMEEPPDAGQLQLGEDVSSYFFSRYGMFQKRIRGKLLKAVQAYNFEVILLEDNENYEELKKKDANLMGVYYDVNNKGFAVTPDFVRTVQQNNPDTIALYYRIDALAFDPATGTIRVSVALSFKNLSDNNTIEIGTKDYSDKTKNTKPDMVMADFGTAVERAMTNLITKDGAGEKLVSLFKKINAKADKPKGPMKLVINCAQVDSKIKIKVRNGLKKSLVAAGLTKKTKVVKDSLSCEVEPSDEFGDLDDVWGKVSEILPEFLGEDIEITDEWAKKNGNTLTVTIGK